MHIIPMCSIYIGEKIFSAINYINTNAYLSTLNYNLYAAQRGCV